MKKRRPITAFLYQLLAEAASALKLTQRNLCDGANQPTASIQPEESLIKTAIQDVKQQPGYEKAAIHTENENADIIQNSVAAKEGAKEPLESRVNSQNF